MPSPADATELQSLFEGVDAARKDAESTWGAERLPIIVDTLPNGKPNPASPDGGWRLKLRRQQRRFSEALQAAWDAERVTGDQMEAVRAAAAAMCRAWPKLAEVASEAGHRPLHVDVWEVRLADGSIAALVRNNDAAAHVVANGRHLTVYTPEEVAAVIDALPAALSQVKQVFPGATIQSPRGDRQWYKNGNDEIPF